MNRTSLIWIATIVLALGVPAHLRGQSAPPADPNLTYLMPVWGEFVNSTDAEVAQQIAILRDPSRIGEGQRVKVGFSAYVGFQMERWDVDPTNPTAIRQAMGGAIAQIDALIAKAIATGVPISFAILNSRIDDGAQQASTVEDIRNVQWYADNSVADDSNGVKRFWTYSRYARKQLRLQEAYVRELGRVLANRMALHPDLLVAAAGDGEVELANPLQGADPLLADYSAFTVAEFRDWLRNGGLYAAGQPYAGQGYALTSRYAGAATPGSDNGSGHSLNGDFGTSFTTWNLKHFDWSLSDDIDANPDPHAITLAEYTSPDFHRLPGEIPTGFDAPRARSATTPWDDVWRAFRESMVARHNQLFAQWITDSADAATGAKVPVSRWYSYQIPGDYLFGLTRGPNQSPRLETSASTVASADVSPYGSIGLTAFNLTYSASGGVVTYRTLAALVGELAQRNERWGLVEWHPCLSGSPTGVSDAVLLAVCRAEMDLIVEYRPGLLAPFAWQLPSSPIENGPFETALRELAVVLELGPQSDPRLTLEAPSDGTSTGRAFTVSGWTADLGARAPGTTDTGVDVVRVTAVDAAGTAIVLGNAQYGLPRADIASTLGTQFRASGFSLVVAAGTLAPGRYRLDVSAHSTLTGTFAVTKSVNITVLPPARDDLVVDFGAAWGLWMRDGDTGGWSQLHTASAKNMVTGDLDGNGIDEVIVDFGSQWGIWVWANNSTWYQLNTATANRMVTGDLDGNGKKEVIIDFPGWGVWVWANNTSWFQLHPSSPNNMVTGDLDGNGKDDVLIDFPGWGIWVWFNNASWFQLNASNSREMAVGDFDGNGKADVIVDFAGWGLWKYSNNNAWSQVTSLSASHMAVGDVDGNGQSDLIIDFGGQFGVWMLVNGTTWSQLAGLSSKSILTADLDSNGKAEVIIDFGAAGLWEYGTTAGWLQLHNTSPRAIVVGRIRTP